MNKSCNSIARNIGRFMGNRCCLFGALILGAALRLWWIHANTDAFPVIPDDFHYFFGACNIFNGHGYSVFGNPITHWPVGYSAFLSQVFMVTGPYIRAAYFANVVLTMAAVVLIWMIARSCFRSLWVANMAALFCALNPDQILSCAFVRSEPLHEVVFFILVLLLIGAFQRTGWMRAVVAGIATGLIAYVRPEYVMVPALLGGCMALLGKDAGCRGGIFRALVIVYVIGAVVTVPGIVRLKNVTGKIYFMSTAADLALFHGNNPFADGRPQAMERVNEIVPANETPREYAVEYIRRHPLRFVELIPLKFWTTYGVRMTMGTPFDVIIINKAPQVLSKHNVERATEGMDDQNKEKFMSALDYEAITSNYRIKRDLSDEAKTMFMGLLLSTHTYDFQTPRGWVLFRQAYRVYRIVQCILIFSLFPLLFVLRSARWRLIELKMGIPLLLTLAGVSSVYLILAGGGRYSFALIPLLWIYPIFLWSLWLSPEKD